MFYIPYYEGVGRHRRRRRRFGLRRHRSGVSHPDKYTPRVFPVTVLAAHIHTEDIYIYVFKGSIKPTEW